MVAVSAPCLTTQPPTAQPKKHQPTHPPPPPFPLPFSLFPTPHTPIRPTPNQGVKFVSETDTEVIAQLIGQGLDKDLSLRDATEEALKR
jgi:hypothetical protein